MDKYCTNTGCNDETHAFFVVEVYANRYTPKVIDYGLCETCARVTKEYLDRRYGGIHKVREEYADGSDAANADPWHYT